MNNNFARFREMNRKRTVAQQQSNTRFVFNAYNSTEISDGERAITAAVVNNQEKESAYIYTHKDEPLTIGSVWGAKGLHWLIAEEIVVIKDVDWHKYSCHLCNFQVENVWGRFIGPQSRFAKVKLDQNDVTWTSEQKPVLILPKNILNFKDKIIIGGRAWLVEEYDAISTNGIVYYSLVPTTASKTIGMEDTYIERTTDHSSEIIVDPIIDEYDVYTVGHNINITINTFNGYFKYSKDIKIIKRSASEVVFSIPFGIDEVEIRYLNGGGEEEARTYKVVN